MAMWIVNYNKTLIQINRGRRSFGSNGFVEFDGELFYRAEDISMLCEINERNKALVEYLSPLISMVIE